MIKKLITISIIAGLVCSAQAQYDPGKVNKKAKALFEKAYGIAMNGLYNESIKTLQDAIKIEPQYLEAFLSIAGLYFELKNYQGAIENYEKAKAIDSVWFKDYNLPYSINLAGKGEFQKALMAIDDFLSLPNLNPQSLKAANYRRKTYQFAIDYSNQHPNGNYRFEPQNMGDSINSTHLEYFPTLTIDDKEFIFTRRVNGNEDFYESKFENGHWTKAKPLPGDINSNQNEGAQNISQDGQWLIFTGCNFPYGHGSCDLYISYLTPEGWSKPENLGNRINTEAWESAPSLSPDKRDLYFASSRFGGYGGQDLYVCHLLPNGRFSDPENLGPEINTIGDESAPFIHADNQTLYFTSGGHLGYGGSDLFMAKKQGKGWSKPVNLGFPINTIENEGSLVIAADGKTAYYTSDRNDSRGGLDLYSFTLREDVRPARTLWVKGKVFDKKTQKGLPSAVELTDLSTLNVISRVQTDATGNYLVTLPVGKDYAFNVKRRGYLFFSENFPLSQKAPDSTYNIDIPLQPIETNASVVLKNIFFDLGKFDLKPESTIELDNIYQLLKENPTLKIQISGHTDNIGKATDNMTLSNNRAQAVVKYLVSKGVEAPRLTFKGYGATQPVADNSTEEGRAQNRRTELQVISQ
ncbi:flagellar motor protein MotB [Niastella caeni]|uniref:Flagellar motor protein MotB n=1 Tax=Niastella caeni TaxID=2569763 RepID=A0A4S8HYX3_9BACT|nr:OmpA family protein [Niastella caeni]THU40880.1 flagellar motor protein MotB [Niastella caeni]